MVTLSEEGLVAALAGLPGWNLRDDVICKTFRFDDPRRAFAFWDAIDFADHGPTRHVHVALTYDAVAVKVTTFDAGGLTYDDVSMASHIERLAA